MPTSVRDLGRGVFLVESPDHASGLVVTSSGAVVIDPGDDESTGLAIRDLLEELGEAARYVIATRSGKTRAPGAAEFPDALLLYPTPGAAPRGDGPAAAFSRDAFLRLGGVAIELLRVAGGEDGVLVRLPGRDLLFAGAVSRPAASRGSVWTTDPERLRSRHRVRRLVPAAGDLWTGERAAVLDGVPLLRAAGAAPKRPRR